MADLAIFYIYAPNKFQKNFPLIKIGNMNFTL